MVNRKATCVAVFGKHKSPAHQKQWRDVALLLIEKQFKVLVHEDSCKMSATECKNDPRFQFATLETIRSKADFAVIIGGDGTFLGVARALVCANIPLLGINQGRLGFLTDIRFHDIDPTLIDTLNGDSVAEQRNYLQGKVIRNGNVVAEQIALNDIVISRGIVGGMVDLHVEVDGLFMYDLRADGLICSTPTGSTAYALSADGPILHPSLAGLVIVPVAPHALTNRPIALPSHSKLTITVTGGKQTGVHFDMQINARLSKNDQIHIQVAPDPIHLIHPSRYDYFAMLRQKLHWSASPAGAPPEHRGLRESSDAK